MIRLEGFPRAWKHIIFWVVLYGLNLLFWGTSLKGLEFALIVNLFFSLFRLPFAYFNIYYLIPKFLEKRRFLNYGIIMLLLLIVHSVFFRFVVAGVWEPLLKPGYEVDYQDSISIFSHLKQFLIEVYVQGIVVAVKLGQDWLRGNKRTAELEKKQVEMELGLLKSQIQPHFFFNTLNSLYALCNDQPKTAAKAILSLSEVMDYVLYKSSKGRVMLKEEMHVVEKYISLEKLRFDKKIKINTQIDEKALVTAIPPVAILSLIENSFKHGLHEVNEEVELSIKINFSTNDELNIIVANTIPEVKVLSKGQGIGLKNLERRLQLMYDEYELKVDSNDKLFIVNLKIPIHADYLCHHR